MDLDIAEDETLITQKFLWSKLSSEDRIEQLSLMLSDVIPQYELQKIVSLANQTYIWSRAFLDSILHKAYFTNNKIDPLLLVNWAFDRQYIIPITLDVKLVYSENAEIGPSIFNKFIRLKDDDKNLPDTPPYQNLLIKSKRNEDIQSGIKVTDKYPKIIADEHNPVSEFSPINSHHVYRYLNLIKPDIIDQRIANSNDTVNVVGLRINTDCLKQNYCTPRGKSPTFDQIHFQWWLSDHSKYSLLRNFLNKVNKNVMKLSWSYIANEITTFHWQILTQFSLGEVNQFMNDVGIKNQQIRRNYAIKIIELSQGSGRNLINYLYQQHTSIWQLTFTLIFYKIILKELGAKNRKEANNLLKMLKGSDKALKFYSYVCKHSKNNSPLICKGTELGQRKDIIIQRFKTLKFFVKEYKHFLKLNKSYHETRKAVRQFIRDSQEVAYKIDLYTWYITQIFGKDFLDKLLKKGKVLYKLLDKKQIEKIDKYAKDLEKQHEKYLKLWQEDNPAISLRFKFDISKDEYEKYRALSTLFHKYLDQQPDPTTLQYYIKGTNIPLVCEHEKIMMIIFKTLSPEKKKKLKQELESEFYAEQITDEKLTYVSCKYCGRFITRTQLKVKTQELYSGTSSYGDRIMGIIDSNILKQIKYIFQLSRLIIKDNASYNINSDTIFSSIINFIKSYIDPKTTRIVNNIKDAENISVSEKVDRAVGLFTIAKIIFEILRSYGNIYPIGSREIVENFKPDLINYLLKWGYRRLKVIPWLKNDPVIKDQVKTESILKQVIAQLTKEDVMVLMSVIIPPSKYRKNLKTDKVLKNYFKEVNIIRPVNIITGPVSREYKRIRDKFKSSGLRKLYTYYNDKYWVDIHPKLLGIETNKLVENQIKLNELSVKKPDNIEDLKRHYKNQFLTLEYDHSDQWIRVFNELGRIGQIPMLVPWKYYYLTVPKKYYPHNRKRKLKDRLNEKNKKLYQNVKQTMETYYVDPVLQLKDYFSNRCLDLTPHFFYGEVCINCGQTLDDIDHPSQNYLELMKKVYSKVGKVKVADILPETPEIDRPKIKEVKINYTNKVSDLVRYWSKTKNGKSNVYKSFAISKFNKTGNGKILIDALINLGTLTKKIKEAQKISGTTKQFSRYRLDQLKTYIQNLEGFYAVLQNNKQTELLKKFVYADLYLKYMHVKPKYQIDERSTEFINDVYAAGNVSMNDKIRIYLSILIGTMWGILIKGKEPLGGMLLSLLDIWLSNSSYLDITEREFTMLDADADLKASRKREAFLSMSMQDKIESGVLGKNFEDQEAFYSELYYDMGQGGINYMPEKVESTVRAYPEASNYPDTVSLYPLQDDYGHALDEKYQDEEGFRDARADLLLNESYN